MPIARDSQHCPGTNRDGSACRSAILLPSGWCASHDPDQRGRLRVLGAKGGHAKSRAARAEKLVPATLRPILDQLIAAMPKIEAGELDARQAGAMASVAGAIVRLYTSATLEERVAALEAAAQPGGRGA